MPQPARNPIHPPLLPKFSNLTWITEIARQTNIPTRTVRVVLEYLAIVMSETLASGNVAELYNFGSFRFKIRKERVTPKGGLRTVPYYQPATVHLRFLPGARLKFMVKQLPPDKKYEHEKAWKRHPSPAAVQARDAGGVSEAVHVEGKV